MKTIRLAVMVLVITILVSCNQGSERDVSDVYEDVEHYLIKDLEEQGESDIKISDKDMIDIEDLGDDLYGVSGELFDKDGTLLATFNMELKYTEDRLDYEWESEPVNDNSNSDLAEDREENSVEEYSPLDILNQLATISKQTEEIYITDDLVIGETEEVKPGIYDLEITGGTGNIFGKHSSLPSLYINWVGGVKGNTGGYPSKIRLLLFEGDILEFKDISKVKFNAISEKVEPSNELGIGEFIVGRDISPGDYKLSTNVNMNPEYENLGWDITIYNDESRKSRDQKLTATNDDVLVSLKEGEIVSISYNNTDHGSSSDDAKLIFIKE